EYDPATKQIIPRKYFSGGMKFGSNINNAYEEKQNIDPAMLSDAKVLNVSVELNSKKSSDRAMTARFSEEDLYDIDKMTDSDYLETFGDLTLDEILFLFQSPFDATHSYLNEIIKKETFFSNDDLLSLYLPAKDSSIKRSIIKKVLANPDANTKEGIKRIIQILEEKIPVLRAQRYDWIENNTDINKTWLTSFFPTEEYKKMVAARDEIRKEIHFLKNSIASVIEKPYGSFLNPVETRIRDFPATDERILTTKPVLNENISLTAVATLIEGDADFNHYLPLNLYYYEKTITEPNEFYDPEQTGSSKDNTDIKLRRFMTYQHKKTGRLFFVSKYDREMLFPMIASYLFIKLLGLPVRNTFIVKDNSGDLLLFREKTPNQASLDEFPALYGQTPFFSPEWERILRGSLLVDQVIGYTDRDLTNLGATIGLDYDFIPFFLDNKYSLGLPKLSNSNKPLKEQIEYTSSKYVQPHPSQIKDPQKRKSTPLPEGFAYNPYHAKATFEDLAWMAHYIKQVSEQQLWEILTEADKIVTDHHFDIQRTFEEWKKSLKKVHELYPDEVTELKISAEKTTDLAMTIENPIAAAEYTFPITPGFRETNMKGNFHNLYNDILSALDAKITSGVDILKNTPFYFHEGTLAIIDRTKTTNLMLGEAVLNALEAIADEADRRNKNYSGQIELKIEKTNDAIMIQLQDNGIGIPEKILRELFKAPISTKRKQRGGIIKGGFGIFKGYGCEILNKYSGQIQIDTKTADSEPIVYTMEFPAIGGAYTLNKGTRTTNGTTVRWTIYLEESLDNAITANDHNENIWANAKIQPTEEEKTKKTLVSENSLPYTAFANDAIAIWESLNSAHIRDHEAIKKHEEFLDLLRKEKGYFIFEGTEEEIFHGASRDLWQGDKQIIPGEKEKNIATSRLGTSIQELSRNLSQHKESGRDIHGRGILLISVEGTKLFLAMIDRARGFPLDKEKGTPIIEMLQNGSFRQREGSPGMGVGLREVSDFVDEFVIFNRGYFWDRRNWLEKRSNALKQDARIQGHKLNGTVVLVEMDFADKALLTEKQKDVGGIDLNAKNLEIKENGEKIEFKMPLNIEELQNAEGFIPVIINIMPITDLPMFLGVNNETEESKKLAKS
ncbi:MAG TPA: ATP-binding protein, partial [Candidatus Omnitrophota bacterium]|nr:ATP-binding protein [Candidatus Omnitrophota bacterium]